MIRSIRLVGGNEAWLPGGRAASSYDRQTFGKTFQAEPSDDGYRSTNPPGAFEHAFDYDFNARGQLTEVHFWIDC